MHIIKSLNSSAADPFYNMAGRGRFREGVSHDVWAYAQDSTLYPVLSKVAHQYMAHIMDEVDDYTKGLHEAA